ncbi:MAG: Asp23/Gls24 family envelope stress response protein [Oscillospiraceae bacterium]|nr:Asp23/Gls24 family envelope stress response protein [Oscillospiraceae bacterium]
MESIESRQPAGSLKISKGVIATIAKTAALEVDGVVSLPEQEVPKVFGRGFGKRAIRVVLTDGFAELDVNAVLKAGARIPDVCTSIQAAVKENVQTMTGIAVSKVNVTVAGIHFPAQE